jgi:hypothetical protein
MTTVRLRRWVRLLLLVPLAAGCKGSGGERTDGLLPRGRDPLTGTERIPPAGVPVPGRDGTYGAAPAKDPLFKGTASRGGSSSKEPFRLTEEFTPAALAARGSDHSDELVIDDRRPVGTPTGGGVKAAGATVPAGNWEAMVEELKRIGGRPFAPEKVNGQYEFRCGVPLGTTGAMRQYTGIGATPLEAVRDVYQQVQAERK